MSDDDPLAKARLIAAKLTAKVGGGFGTAVAGGYVSTAASFAPASGTNDSQFHSSTANAAQRKAHLLRVVQCEGVSAVVDASARVIFLFPSLGRLALAALDAASGVANGGTTVGA